MIAHDHIRVQLPAAAIHRFKQAALKSLPRILPQKQLLAIVASAHHMVDRPGVFDTLLAWHPLSMAPNKTPCQCLYSTFDPLFLPDIIIFYFVMYGQGATIFCYV